MGTPKFSVPILKSIHESNHNLVTVYTQPPKKKFRGQKETSSPVHEFANKINIPVRCPNDLKNKNEIEFIKNTKPDIVIVVAYGKILPEELLNIKSIRFINLHASLLPKWRGAAPIQRAIMNLDIETGISVMQIVKKLDAGPVMKMSKIEITKKCNYETLSEKLSDLGALAIIESLKLLETKRAKFIPQKDQEATYAKKVEKSEAKINWNEKSAKIIAKINALNPNPGTWFKLDGSRIKVIEAEEFEKNGKPGEIIDNKFVIGCLDKSIKITKLKKEGKKSMSSTEFLKGFDLKIGKMLE